MTKDDILRLAREAFGSLIFVPDENGLLRFAALVAAAERERCAKVCDEARDAIWPYHKPDVLNAACTVCENLANRIRGLGA